MRQILSLALVLILVARFGPAAFAAENIKGQITRMPTGVNIEVRLKSKQKLRGVKAEASDSGFTLVEPGSGNRQIAFDDVASVKQLGNKSHTRRNVLIVAGIAVVVLVVAGAQYARALGHIQS